MEEKLWRKDMKDRLHYRSLVVSVIFSNDGVCC